MTLAHSMPKRSKSKSAFEFLRVAILRSSQLREAGTPWHEQGWSKWCAARALPRVTACAAAAVLTAVLARAEYFTLAPAGTTLEQSDGCSWSTPRSRSCTMMAQLVCLQAAWPPASSL